MEQFKLQQHLEKTKALERIEDAQNQLKIVKMFEELDEKQLGN